MKVAKVKMSLKSVAVSLSSTISFRITALTSLPQPCPRCFPKRRLFLLTPALEHSHIRSTDNSFASQPKICRSCSEKNTVKMLLASGIDTDAMRAIEYQCPFIPCRWERTVAKLYSLLLRSVLEVLRKLIRKLADAGRCNCRMP